MFDWIMRHISGMLDWALVFVCVFTFVFLLQLVVNYLNGPVKSKENSEKSD